MMKTVALIFLAICISSCTLINNRGANVNFYINDADTTDAKADIKARP